MIKFFIKKILFKINYKNNLVRIKKNLNSTIINLTTKGLSNLIYIPLFILFYNTDLFGVWVFLLSIPTFFSGFIPNFVNATTTKKSISYNSEKKNLITKDFSNLFFLQLTASILFCIICFILLKINFLEKLKSLELYSEFYINNIFAVLVLVKTLDIITTPFGSILDYRGNIYINTNLETIFDFLEKFFIILIGISSNDIFKAAMCLLVISLIKLITYIFLCKKVLPIKYFYFNLIKFSSIINIISISKSYYLENFNSKLKENLQTILIGSFFGSNIVGMISSIKTMFYYFPLRFWGTLQKILYYEFLKLHSLNKKLYIKYFLSKLTIIYLILAFIFLIFVFFLGEYLYKIWINNSFNSDFYLILFISIDVVILILAAKLKILNKSINKFFSITFFSFIIYLLIISCSYFLFNLGFNYLYIFILNIFGTLLISIYTFFVLKKTLA